MVLGFRYIQLDEDGRVKASCDTPIEGVTIDIEGMAVPDEPTDGIYELYYSEEAGLHWKKVVELDDIPLTVAEETTAQVSYLVMKAKGGTSA